MSKILQLSVHLQSQSLITPFANNKPFTGNLMGFKFFFNLTTRMSACNPITKIRPCWDFYILHSNIQMQRKENTRIHSFCPSKSGMTPVRRKPQIKRLLISLVRGSGALNFFITSITATFMQHYCYLQDLNSEPQLSSSQLHTASDSIPHHLLWLQCHFKLIQGNLNNVSCLSGFQYF